MQTDNWKNIKDVLLEVLSLDQAERQSFLERAAISPETREEVRSLLAFETESEDLMRLSAVEYSKDFFETDAGEKNVLIGQQIGAYEIVSELGYGGMGAVYLARRTDGKFNQNVALKLLKREMNTAALRQRFSREREILASLEHPNIARLLDAGTTDDQIPFIAMEYVEGLPIDEFCDKQRLDLTGRLNLFRSVCAAVNYAHRNLIVHRDLKPSNILVSDDGTAKLLDFGISKILSSDIAAVNAQTVTRLGVMTPSYASPEQLRSESVTTATDVYSLGVILYELLSGHRPFESKEADLKEIYRAVIDTDPPLPSAMANRTKELSDKSNATTVIKSANSKPAANRTAPIDSSRTAPQPFNIKPQFLRGDLDNIILKALKKEPERRYSSAENFSEDIKRHLDGLPVLARPDTFSYRAEKFVRRNSLSVLAGALILLAILGGAVATLWQARIARDERVKAEKRFNDVRALANSFLFEFNPLIENLPGSTPARELLVKRALEYLDNLSNEAGADEGLQRELAEAYEKVGDVQGNPQKASLGDTKGAIQSYEKSLHVRENLLARKPEDVELQSGLADVYKRLGETYFYSDDVAKSDESYDKSLALTEKNLERQPDSFELRAKLSELFRVKGLNRHSSNEYQKAIEFYRRANEINEKLVAERPGDAKILEQYAYIFVAIGEAQAWDNETENAELNLQKGLDLLIPLGEKYPNDYALQRSVMLAYQKRAEVYEDAEVYDKSNELYLIALDAAKKKLELDPRNFLAKRDVAMAYKKLAQTLDAAGKSLESLEKLQLALDGFKQLAATDPNNAEAQYDVANTGFSIGETLLTMKDYRAAREILLDAQRGYESVLTKNPANNYAQRMIAFNDTRLGMSYAGLAEKSDGRENLQKSLTNFRSGLERLKRMKAEGNLGEFDDKEIADVEKQTEAVAAKIK